MMQLKLWVTGAMAALILANTQLAPCAAKKKTVVKTKTSRTKQKKVAVPAHFLGSWRGMTRMQRYDEPMFTAVIKPNGVWTDLTFGESHAKIGRYTFDAKAKVLTLYSAANNVLYKFRRHAPEAGEKERLVETLPEKELYRAMVCYRYEAQ